MAKFVYVYIGGQMAETPAAQEQAGLSVVRLTPAIDSRRVALLQRRGGYRSAAARAFVAVAQDYAKAIQD